MVIICPSRSRFMHLTQLRIGRDLLNARRRKYCNSQLSSPLRILFCGSDEFSIASLQKLHAEHCRDPQFIKSIDVLCRPGKRTGRSLKTIREAPIKAAAQNLGFEVHERDTFTGWQLPPKPEGDSINLIVAVSFGLFIPPRIIQAVQYGGLNVHPSLLPNFQGPAPLHHVLLRGERVTGVTLQTLDENSFDRGVILAQHRFSIPNADACTYSELLKLAAPRAANILVEGLRARLYVPPLVGLKPPPHNTLYTAPKITKLDHHIEWTHCDAFNIIMKKHRVLGRLWCAVYISDESIKRLVFEDFEKVEKTGLPRLHSHTCFHGRGMMPQRSVSTDTDSSVPQLQTLYSMTVQEAGSKCQLHYSEDDDGVVFSVPGGLLRVKQITIEGQHKKPAVKAMQEIRAHSVAGQSRSKTRDSPGLVIS